MEIQYGVKMVTKKKKINTMITATNAGSMKLMLMEVDKNSMPKVMITNKETRSITLSVLSAETELESGTSYSVFSMSGRVNSILPGMMLAAGDSRQYRAKRKFKRYLNFSYLVDKRCHRTAFKNKSRAVSDNKIIIFMNPISCRLNESNSEGIFFMNIIRITTPIKGRM